MGQTRTRAETGETEPGNQGTQATERPHHHWRCQCAHASTPPRSPYGKSTSEGEDLLHVHRTPPPLQGRLPQQRQEPGPLHTMSGSPTLATCGQQPCKMWPPTTGRTSTSQCEHAGSLNGSQRHCTPGAPPCSALVSGLDIPWPGPPWP